jgi:hypothetical protein
MGRFLIDRAPAAERMSMAGDPAKVPFLSGG